VPTDIGLIVANLTAFYDFKDKVVVHVGAGGGQLVGYAPLARRVLAVDKDPVAVRRLEERIAAQGLDGRVLVVIGDFLGLELAGDVVLLEFCLHEMREPGAVIERARAIAPDVVVIDHLPESSWSFYADETEQMARAWDAVASARVRRGERCEARQRFDTYHELKERLSAQGQESRRRIERFRHQAPVEVSMPYGIALL
jgi:hypothetical protein